MEGLQQGALTVESLRAISGRIDKRLAVFVEDEFAKHWVLAAARERLGERVDEIGVYAIGGDGAAANIHRGHSLNPSIAFRSLCFVDGDSKQKDDPASKIFRLPGGGPETSIFNGVLTNLEANVAFLTVACQRPVANQQQVLNVVRDISYTNRDPHLLFSQIGARLGFVAEATVRGAFLITWI